MKRVGRGINAVIARGKPAHVTERKGFSSSTPSWKHPPHHPSLNPRKSSNISRASSSHKAGLIDNSVLYLLVGDFPLYISDAVVHVVHGWALVVHRVALWDISSKLRCGPARHREVRNCLGRFSCHVAIRSR